jgi:hypothetical protein
MEGTMPSVVIRWSARSVRLVRFHPPIMSDEGRRIERQISQPQGAGSDLLERR